MAGMFIEFLFHRLKAKAFGMHYISEFVCNLEIHLLLRPNMLGTDARLLIKKEGAAVS